MEAPPFGSHLGEVPGGLGVLFGHFLSLLGSMDSHSFILLLGVYSFCDALSCVQFDRRVFSVSCYVF